MAACDRACSHDGHSLARLNISTPHAVVRHTRRLDQRRCLARDAVGQGDEFLGGPGQVLSQSPVPVEPHDRELLALRRVALLAPEARTAGQYGVQRHASSRTQPVAPGGRLHHRRCYFVTRNDGHLALGDEIRAVHVFLDVGRTDPAVIDLQQRLALGRTGIGNALQPRS